MAKPADDLSKCIQYIRFIGRSSGAVKTLGGFKKSHHTLPDAVNAATSAFLAKLCTDELAEEAEGFFQRARTIFGYKRKEVSLDVTSPQAVLSAKDFNFEIAYALEENDPASYNVTRTLHSVTNGDLVQTAEFEEVFAGLFAEISFVLTRGAPVETVVDAIEGLDADANLKVNYPSDCRECTLLVEGVSAEVKFTGPELSMIFPRKGSPRELLEAFATVRKAFVLSKARALAGLLG